MLIKSGIFDFRNRLEKRLLDTLTSYTDVLRVNKLIADIQSEMLKELGDGTD